MTALQPMFSSILLISTYSKEAIGFVMEVLSKTKIEIPRI